MQRQVEIATMPFIAEVAQEPGSAPPANVFLVGIEAGLVRKVRNYCACQESLFSRGKQVLVMESVASRSLRMAGNVHIALG